MIQLQMARNAYATENFLGSSQSGSASFSGAITATLTWQGSDANDLPPASVIVQESCTATATGNGTNAVPTVAAADGFGDPAVFTPRVGGPFSLTGTSKGNRYSVKNNPGQSFTVTCTPTGSVSTNAGYVLVNLTYKVVTTLVTISLAGTTPVPGPPGIGVLIGQQLTASLNTGNNPQSNWQWSVSGDPFAGFVVTNTSGYPLELTTAMKQQASMQFFYRSLGGAGGTNAPSTITCTATITLPDGTQPQVTGSKQVAVYAPYPVLFSHLAGTMTIYGSVPNPQFLLPFLQSTGRGMQWTGQVTTPSLFTANGNGAWLVVQLATPTATKDGVSVFPNGITGLDGGFPYYNHAFPANGMPGTDGDTPRLDLTTAHTSASFSCSFQTYVLYQPPQAAGSVSTVVPLWEMDWTFEGQAVNLITWQLTSGNGILVTRDAPTAVLPTWTQIVSVPAQ